MKTDDEDSEFSREDLESEMQDGYVISDGDARGAYHIHGPDMNTFVDDWHEAIITIARHMDSNKYWPGVFYINDHGNVDVIAITRGKRGVISYKTVESYV